MNNGMVYILECSDNTYYTGVTNDIDRRLAEHKMGIDKQCYTYSRRPVKLLWTSEEIPIDQAIDLERMIKGWRREKKEALMNREYEKLPDLSQAYSSKRNKRTGR